ncbi:hypothetical protein N9N67_05090 [Bacteriovoracaceae bacterium]|nr:hypothetical protein [Bacteriovoracaceae bacterium]
MTKQVFFTSDNLENKFYNIVSTLIPRSRDFTSDQKRRSYDIVNEFLEDKPGAIHFKIKLFFTLIDITTFFKFFKTFKAASLEQRNEVCQFLFDCNIPLLRKGFWGINTLAKLSVFSQSTVHQDIGYQIKQ